LNEPLEAVKTLEILPALVSAIGPKQTWALAVHMSAFGVKADMENESYPRFSPAELRGWGCL
jgi:hypothetical protein